MTNSNVYEPWIIAAQDTRDGGAYLKIKEKARIRLENRFPGRNIIEVALPEEDGNERGYFRIIDQP